MIYVKLYPSANIKALEESLQTKVEPILGGKNGPPLEAFNHKLQPVYDIHTSPGLNQEKQPTVRRSSLNILFLVVTVLISVLSSLNLFQNLTILKEANKQKGMQAAVPLVIFQFVMVIALIAFALLLNKQMNFIERKDLGYTSENVIVIKIPQQNAKVDIFRNELLKIPGVINAGTARHYPGYRFQDMNFSSGDNAFPFRFGQIDQNAIETLNIKTLRYFTEAENEATDGWLVAFFIPGPDSRIIRFVLARIHQNKSSQVITAIENKLSDIYPGQPVNYSFLDEQLKSEYASERLLMRLINVFSILAILIASLGLMGLSIFMTEKRTKEIGIRKVNGSSVYEIVQMLNIVFIKWLGLAFVIATPIAYYVSLQWLQNFAYRTKASWCIFILSGIIALFIVIITVSWQTFKVARRNPVEALRYE